MGEAGCFIKMLATDVPYMLAVLTGQYTCRIVPRDAQAKTWYGFDLSYQRGSTATVPSKAASLSLTADDLFKTLEAQLVMGVLAAADTRDTEKQVPRDKGLVPNHAYSVLEARTVNLDGRTERLIKLRDPLRGCEWTGDWSDNSPLWQQHLKVAAELRYGSGVLPSSSDADGTFWMPWAAFLTYFDGVTLCGNSLRGNAQPWAVDPTAVAKAAQRLAVARRSQEELIVKEMLEQERAPFMRRLEEDRRARRKAEEAQERKRRQEEAAGAAKNQEQERKRAEQERRQAEEREWQRHQQELEQWQRDAEELQQWLLEEEEKARRAADETARRRREQSESPARGRSAAPLDSKILKLLGDTLVDRNERAVATQGLFGRNKVLGLFFATSNSPRAAQLRKFYEAFKRKHPRAADFEIVYIGYDPNPDMAAQALYDMPWLALGLGKTAARDLLASHCRAQLNMLVMVDGYTGAVTNPNALLEVLGDAGGRGFPWPAAAVDDEAAARQWHISRAEASRERSMRGDQDFRPVMPVLVRSAPAPMAPPPEAPAAVSGGITAQVFKLLGPKLETGSGGVKPVSKITGKGRLVGLLFASGHDERCRDFTAELAAIYNGFKANHPRGADWEVVLVSTDNDESGFRQHVKRVPWPAMAFAQRGDKERLVKLLGVKKRGGGPTLVLVEGEHGRVVNADAGQAVLTDRGCKRFPWQEEDDDADSDGGRSPVAAPSRRPPLAAVSVSASGPLTPPRAASDERAERMPRVFTVLGDWLVRTDGTKVPVTSITGAGKVVAIYFSAHWCPPCATFTPKLAAVYRRFKQHHPRRADWEIVFASCDQEDKASWQEYFGSMPWIAVPYSSAKRVVGKLTDMYDVSHIPRLLLLDGETGEVIKDNAAGLVLRDRTCAGFPWRQQ
ncbi:hypothetical protein HXX76_012419 [Chlamydomonas incerta]|uniref:Uncharacterized protein n=1 Tax=Chlamydomonas incerta TaxID=51695 RepID=A0A835SL01_CHLIN|nr:hypothetical protein HXX76_012419 [Chlamydomonas incerta]|eukprot:KAG2427486.1 hypothetical protein HXX76_012419 [Chlamydomonas incerta]